MTVDFRGQKQRKWGLCPRAGSRPACWPETRRTHLTWIVFLAEIVDVFLQFNLWEKIIWCILNSTSPLVVYFCLFLPICLLIKCEIKYTCIATSPWNDPFLFCVLKGGLNTSYVPRLYTGLSWKIKKKKKILTSLRKVTKDKAVC